MNSLDRQFTQQLADSAPVPSTSAPKRNSYTFIVDKMNGMQYLPFSDTEDAIILSETHGSSNQICSQTLEDGREYRDHVVNEPDSLNVEIHVPNRSTRTVYPISYVYKVLKELCRNRRLLKVTTFLQEYDNMVIQDVSTPITSPYKGMSTVSVKFAPLLLLEDGTIYLSRSPAIGKFQDPGPVYLDRDEIPEEPEKLVKWSALKDLQDGLAKFLLESALQSLVDLAIDLVALIGVAKAVCNFNSFGRALGVNGKDDDPDISQKAVLASFNANVGASMMSVEFSYDASRRCHCTSIYDVNGNAIALGIPILPGANCVKGLNIAIPSSDGKDTSSLYAIFVTAPFRNGEWEWEAVSKPDAFTPDERTGIPPCTLIFAGDSEAYEAYSALMAAMARESLYDFDRLGYTVISQ